MNSFFNYLSESRAELAKVNWPNRRQLVRLTAALIVFCVVVGLFIGGIDFVFSQALQKLILKV